MKRITKDVWVTVASLAAVVTVFGGLLWYPTLKERMQYASRQQGAESRLAEINATQAELDRLSVEVAQLRERVAADDFYVPGRPELSPMLRGWTESVERQGIRGQELVTSEFERYAEYSMIPASLDFSAGFDSLFEALRAIETHPRLTAVQSLELRAEPADNAGFDEPVVEVSLELNTYFTQVEGGRP